MVDLSRDIMEKHQNLKSKLIVKAVRNIRKGYFKDDAARGMYRPGIKLDLERTRYITESYKMTKGEPMTIRRAKFLDHYLSNISLFIKPWERIVGNYAKERMGLYHPIDLNWRSVHRLLHSKEGKNLLDDEERAELDECCEYWKGKSMSDRHQNFFGEELMKYWQLGSAPFTWTQWTELGVPNYEKIFQIGLKGIITEAEEKLNEIENEIPRDYVGQKEFILSVLIALKAVIKFANRYSDYAVELAKSEKIDEDFKNRLIEIAEICRWVPENPPRNFHEALQAFYFIHLIRFIEYSTLGCGIRFDKVIGPYYEKDITEGRITRDEALELLQLLWIKLNEIGIIYSPILTQIYAGVSSLQSIMLGGTDSEGNDITNEVTYLVLETALLLKTIEPTIGLRIHEGTPDKLFEMAVDVIRTGIGYPSLFNDLTMIPLLQRWNIPLKDARDYSITGCVYIEIPGKNMMRRAMGGINPLGVLYFVLHPKNFKTGKQLGAPTPDPRTFKNIDDVFDAYLEQLRYFLDKHCNLERANNSLYEKYLPRPFYSAIVDDCIKKGQDSRKFAYPSSTFCVIIGITNAADSIAAINKVVFEDKKVSMDELIKAMDKNWRGYENIRQLMLQAPKYGNDDDYVDNIMNRLQIETEAVLESFRDYFGNPIHGDGSALSASYGWGFRTPASPDGRFSGESLADSSLAPMFGRDIRGPTAVLNSAAKVDPVQTYNHLLNQRFLPSYLEGDYKQVFINYLKTWRDLKVPHVQFNVVDNETLRDAMAHPEKHQDLLVRVAGYSAYFVDLSKGLQEFIIARNEQKF
ncbi:MAG: pyruvate formate lyase family protein [Candidatus Hodarchaeota archaeon]